MRLGGSATIQGQNTPAVIVNQATSNAVINWNTFNIRANESVRFNQPSSSSVVLNRVTGGGDWVKSKTFFSLDRVGL